MKNKNISLFALGLLLIIPTSLMAQEAATQGPETNNKWLQKQDIHLRDEVATYKESNASKETLELIRPTEPFTQEFDFNEMLRQKMAWDRNLSRDNSYLDRCRLSLGVVKVDKVMGGAMLRVKLFD